MIIGDDNEMCCDLSEKLKPFGLRLEGFNVSFGPGGQVRWRAVIKGIPLGFLGDDAPNIETAVVAAHVMIKNPAFAEALAYKRCVDRQEYLD